MRRHDIDFIIVRLGLWYLWLDVLHIDVRREAVEQGLVGLHPAANTTHIQVSLLQLRLTVVLEAESRQDLLLLVVVLGHRIDALPPVGVDVRALTVVGAGIAQDVPNAVVVAFNPHQTAFVGGIGAVLDLGQLAVDLLPQLLLLVRCARCAGKAGALAQLVRRKAGHLAVSLVFLIQGFLLIFCGETKKCEACFV